MEPERQLATSIDLSKNSVICVRIHGHHSPVRTVSNLPLGWFKPKSRSRRLMNTSPVASVILHQSAMALCICWRTTSGPWIYTVIFYNSLMDRMMTAGDLYSSSIARYWIVSDIFFARSHTVMTLSIHSSVNMVARDRKYIQKCRWQTGGGTFKYSASTFYNIASYPVIGDASSWFDNCANYWDVRSDPFQQLHC